MNQREHQLIGLSERLVDIDLTPSGRWVGVSAYGTEQSLYFNGFRLPVPAPCRFPIVRALSDFQVVLVDSRSRRPELNARVVNADGEVLAQFRAGDAIADIIPFETRIAVTYFDEAFGNREERDGLVVLDLAGHQLFHYSAVDCYCACALNKRQLLALFYPDFPLVQFDSATYRETTWNAPEQLAGASAVTTIGDSAFFHGTYQDRAIIQRWRIGTSSVESVGAYTGFLRGIGHGEFLAIGEAKYTLVSFNARP